MTNKSWIFTFMKDFSISVEGLFDFGLLLTILETYSAKNENDKFFVVKDGRKILL